MDKVKKKLSKPDIKKKIRSLPEDKETKKIISKRSLPIKLSTDIVSKLKYSKFLLELIKENPKYVPGRTIEKMFENCSININTKNLVGSGLTGNVYTLGKNTVIKRSKLYLGDFIPEAIISMLLTKEVNDGNTIHFPKTYDINICQDVSYIKLERFIEFKLHSFKNILHNLFAQVCFALYFAQKKYKFRHNDFHYGNVMLKKTNLDIKYFNYKVEDQWYKIPNLGYAIVIIDFGQSGIIYKHKKINYDDYLLYDITTFFETVNTSDYIEYIPEIFEDIINRQVKEKLVKEYFKQGLYSEYKVNKKWPFKNEYFSISFS